ncbi:MAG: hypothetical protein MMC33_004656 [Icmadophila ericetorum]|nr:hypothetical protein [Icmadophila ericetorum]
MASGTVHPQVDALAKREAWYLYISHFLSMWNSRMYEFAVILFIQAAFPGNLLASSINGIAETICVLFFSFALGRWVDRAPSRLHTLLITIITNRVTVTVLCLIWVLILSSTNPTLKKVLFALVLILGMVEKDSRMANILSMERDWIPTLASSVTEAAYDLTYLNTVMRRIDTICKFLAPLAISACITLVTPKPAALGVASLSLMSFGPECWCVQKVWKQSDKLRTRKQVTISGYERNNIEDISIQNNSLTSRSLQYSRFVSGTLVAEIRASCSIHLNGLRCFFHTSVWLPSLCAAVLHASVLTYSSSLVTYLLNAGFTLATITVVRAIGSVFEIGSTFVFQWAVAILSRSQSSQGRYELAGIDEGEDKHVMEEDSTSGDTNSRETEDAKSERALVGSDATQGLSKQESQDKVLQDETSRERAEGLEAESNLETVSSPNVDAAVARVGLWGLLGLSVNLIPAMISLFYLDSTLSSVGESFAMASPLFISPISTMGFFVFLSLSFLGRWTYDLSTTQLTQTLVSSTYRSSFGGTEMAVGRIPLSESIPSLLNGA